MCKVTLSVTKQIMTATFTIVFALTFCVGSVLLETTEYAPIIKLKGGQVRGLLQQLDHHKLHFYEGIRYGQAQRFAKPTLAAPWTGIYNATKPRDACPQPMAGAATRLIQGVSHSEDCLYLNIWRPAETKANRPVMLWIHGGAFTIGTIFSISVDGQYIAQQGDVIMVAINYRLGPFGFLYGGSEEHPGNLGFHDQILALQWVQQNIAQFGGDPTQVTIFGESAGSSSVGSLLLSPLASGLFKRAIMQSGAPSFAYVHTDAALVLTKTFARKLNCFNDNSSLIINCLKTKNFTEIVNATKFTLSNDYFQPIYGDQVLPVKPQEALKSGKFNKNVDLLYGVVNREGAYYAKTIFPKYLTNATITLESATADIVYVMQLFGHSFGKEVAHQYLGHLTANATQDELKAAVSEAIGDHRVVCPTILFAEQLAKFSPSSNYFSYRLMQHFQFPGFPTISFANVTHGEDLFPLFLIPFLTSADDKQLSNAMIHSWTKFAKTGKPGHILAHKWTSSLSGNNSSTSFMALHANQFKMVKGFYLKSCETFWKPKLLA